MLALAVVLIVIIVLAGFAPGMIEVGLNEHVLLAGKPEQVNPTALPNEPPRGETVSVKVADCPALIVTEPEEVGATSKSVIINDRESEVPPPGGGLNA